jgi:hypothetical protein
MCTTVITYTDTTQATDQTRGDENSTHFTLLLGNRYTRLPRARFTGMIQITTSSDVKVEVIIPIYAIIQLHM